jgi:phosphoglycolate phosphatase
MLRQIDMLVFDLDGTLVDSKTDIVNAVNFTLGSFGIDPLATELIAKHVGTGVMPLIEKTLNENGVKDFTKALKIFGDFYLQHLTDQTRLYDGMLEVLQHFALIPKVILTNKSLHFAAPILHRLDLEKHFVRCYGRESFKTRKPDPGPLLAISSEFKLALKEIAMIGDTEVDMIAGKAAGTTTVAATYGFGIREVLLEQKPDFQISQPSDLIRLFSSNQEGAGHFFPAVAGREKPR